MIPIFGFYVRAATVWAAGLLILGVVVLMVILTLGEEEEGFEEGR